MRAVYFAFCQFYRELPFSEFIFMEVGLPPSSILRRSCLSSSSSVSEMDGSLRGDLDLSFAFGRLLIEERLDSSDI